MAYLGRWQIDALLTFPVTTHTASTGAVTDADSVPIYRLYEDETATPILTGSMAKLDDANTTGFYSEQITLSAANGFEVGKSYTILVSATVSSVTGTLPYTFQVEAAPATAAALAALNNLSAAQVNSEVDTALADYDAPTKAELDAGFAALNNLSSAQAQTAATAALNAYDPPTKAELDAGLAAIAIPTVADILAGVIEGSITLKGALRLALAVLAGESTGGGTATVTFRDVADAKARVTATVTAVGDRTAIVRDITD